MLSGKAACCFERRRDWLVCCKCGLVVPYSEDTPQANCTGVFRRRGTARSRPTRRDAVLARYDAAPNPLPIARTEVERRLDVCEACNEYADLTCIRAGSPCQRGEHWQQKVLTLDCEKWQ